MEKHQSIYPSESSLVGGSSSLATPIREALPKRYIEVAPSEDDCPNRARYIEEILRRRKMLGRSR